WWTSCALSTLRMPPAVIPPVGGKPRSVFRHGSAGIPIDAGASRLIPPRSGGAITGGQAARCSPDECPLRPARPEGGKPRSVFHHGYAGITGRRRSVEADSHAERGTITGGQAARCPPYECPLRSSRPWGGKPRSVFRHGSAGITDRRRSVEADSHAERGTITGGQAARCPPYGCAPAVIPPVGWKTAKRFPPGVCRHYR